MSAPLKKLARPNIDFVRKMMDTPIFAIAKKFRDDPDWIEAMDWSAVKIEADLDKNLQRAKLELGPDATD